MSVVKKEMSLNNKPHNFNFHLHDFQVTFFYYIIYFNYYNIITGNTLQFNWLGYARVDNN